MPTTKQPTQTPTTRLYGRHVAFNETATAYILALEASLSRCSGCPRPAPWPSAVSGANEDEDEDDDEDAAANVAPTFSPTYDSFLCTTAADANLLPRAQWLTFQFWPVAHTTQQHKHTNSIMSRVVVFGEF